SGAAWAIGVARASVRRKGRIAVQPAAGIWAVGQCGTQCHALTSPSTPIPLPQNPQVIGVYLDCGAGRVAFWDSQREIPMF
ncbi:TRI15 protein, partial [Grantiella picta]|nr:TRI15 protein [Grantiella picta]